MPNLSLMRGETQWRARHKLSLIHNLNLFWCLAPHQSKLSQHQSTNRETNTVIQHTKLLRDHALRHTFERLLQFMSGGRNIISNDHLEILATANTTSRVVLQKHARLFVYPSRSDDHEVRRFSVDLEIDRPARERGSKITITRHNQER